jgi:hypothetical protein
MQIECPRCEKHVPAWAAYCRRCGMSLEHVVPLRLLSTARTTPPLTRLLGIILVGCLICMAALNSRSPYDHPRSGGYGGGGGGGGGGPVLAPVNPFGFVPGVQAPGVQGSPTWPQPYESPQPGRVYRPSYNSGRDPYVPSYRGSYGRPSSPPYGNSYGGPSAPGGSRGPGG